MLIQRRNLKRTFLDLENTIRHSLKSFGVRLHKVGRGGFDAAVRTASADDPLTAELMDCMLEARAALWKQYLKLHDMVVKIVARDALCRRLMAIPGVGPITALTSKRWQSGTSIDIQGSISKAGDPDVRRALYEAASAMLTRFKGTTTLKTWGLKLAKRCHKKAVVAVAHKLAVIMHAMWRDGTEYLDRPADSTSTTTTSAKDRKLLGACV